MNSNQIIILSVFLGYLLFNVVVSFVYSRKAEKSLNTSEEKKYFIGGRNMNGIVLAMTIMATYTSASSFQDRAQQDLHMAMLRLGLQQFRCRLLF